jgi:hypothetical protein
VATAKLTCFLSQLTKNVFINFEVPYGSSGKMHHIKIDITYISTYFERFNLLSCYCYRKTNGNYNKSNFGYDMGKEGKDFPNSSHIQHHSSHSVNGPDFSAVIQYVFYVYCSVHR